MPWREFSEGSVSHQGVEIPYKLRRSKRRRKTLQISVGPDGVRVAVPYRTPNRRIHALVLKRASWILKQLEKQKNRPPPREFVTGETMPYLGRDVPIVVEKGDFEEANVRFHKWRFLVDAPDVPDDDELREDIGRAFLRWYWTRATERADEGVERWRPVMGIRKKPRVIIGNQRTLWGSCAADGTLRFNWRLVMTPPRLMDYVVVHELAHLKVRNHSPDFWKVVNHTLPEAQLLRRELRETGRNLPL